MLHNILKFETCAESEIGKGQDEIKNKITLNAPKRVHNPEYETAVLNVQGSSEKPPRDADTKRDLNTRNNALTSNDFVLRKTTVEISTAANTKTKFNSKNANRLKSRIEGISIIIDSESTPPLDYNDKPLRSSMIDNRIIIYKNHPMFEERTKGSNLGVQIISSELIFYIATEIMTQFKTLFYNENKDSITNMGAFFQNISEGVYLFVSELKPLEGKNLSELININ